MPETCLKVLSFCLHLHSYKTASLSRVLIISPPFLAPPPPRKILSSTSHDRRLERRLSREKDSVSTEILTLCLRTPPTLLINVWQFVIFYIYEEKISCPNKYQHHIFPMYPMRKKENKNLRK